MLDAAICFGECLREGQSIAAAILVAILVVLVIVVVVAGAGAIVNCFAKGQRTHPIVVAIEKTGCVMTGSIIHCDGRGRVREREKKRRAILVCELARYVFCVCMCV